MKKLRLAFVGTLIVALMLTGCYTSKRSEHETSISPAISPVPTAANIRAEYIKISPEEAQAMMSDDVIILDVRTQEEYDEGHIANAILLPDYDIQEKAETVITDKRQIILVYCRTGKRSERAAKELIDMGYEKVYDFGGIEDWTGEIVGNVLYPTYYNYFGGELPPDIITPIDFTVTKKISDQLPEFNFQLTGNNVKSYGVSNDNTKCYIMFDENNIENITITDDIGALVQEIDGIITKSANSEEEMYGITFDDWNFDGYIDIGLRSYQGGSMLNDPHYYWLWDNSLGQFVENAELMEISNFFTISINTEVNRLECDKILGIFGSVTQYYEYLDDQFVLVYSYTLEIVPSPEDEDKNLRHITIEELVDGESKITEDYYEDIEK
jgi:phage shock protein E